MPRHACASILALLALAWTAHADSFDHYTNPVLAKVPKAAGVKELTKLTQEQISENSGVLPDATAALIVVQTVDGRWSKLLVQTARKKVGEDLVPVLLIDRFVTYKEGTDRTVVASGKNMLLFDGFVFSLEMGQVVPARIGGDLRFVVKDAGSQLEPVAKAKLYLLTKPLAQATPAKAGKFEMGATFEPRYFAGKFKLLDDGRRSGTLILTVKPDSTVAGSFTSDKDGKEYKVTGKIGAAKHGIQFTIEFPRINQSFQGWMFTGDGKAIAGTSRMQDREAGFYALRVE